MNNASKELLSSDPDQMQCFVYKGSLKDDHFLFLPCLIEELNGVDNDEAQASSDQVSKLLPAALLARLGELSYVTEFTLHAQRFMPQADPIAVMADISKQGFYLQIPKTTVDELEDSFFK